LPVIPTHWTAVHRPEDGEHVGCLAPDGARAEPRLLAGPPLSPARPPAMPAGVLAADEPEPDRSWRPVVLVEVSPDGCTIRPEMAAPEELTARAALPIPVGDLRREEPPGG
jgi:hypothetical protein